jgi:hypothetical protein
VTPRHIVLVVASVALLAAGVYLFKEVRATPATADVSKRPDKVAPAPESDDPEATTPEKTPERTASRRPSPPVRSAPDAMMKEPMPASSSDTPKPAIDSVNDELNSANPKMEAVMAEANKAYDKGDFEDARGIALKVLAKEPTNVRMLRIAVSSACIDGDSAEAQKHYLVLPAGDREQMKVRCARYGVTFNDK